MTKLETLSWMTQFATAGRQAKMAESYLMELLSALVERPKLSWRA